jgi:predicted transcriptional regulator
LTTIKELQNNSNISNIEMAQILDISPSAYCDKKNRRRKFQPAEIAILCKYFSVSVTQVEDFLVRDMRNANKNLLSTQPA